MIWLLFFSGTASTGFPGWHCRIIDGGRAGRLCDRVNLRFYW